LETTFDYLRQFGPLLAERILETYPPLQSTKDPVAPSLAGLLRKPLPAQAVAITGTAKHLRKAKAARIVAECGAGKTFMALGTIHVLSEGRPTTTLVMCPSHITHKWAREVLLTIPRARTFLIEDMRNGGDPSKQHGVCEVKLSKGKTIYEGKRLSLAEMRRIGRKEWRKKFSVPTFFITGKDKGKLSYFWDHAYLTPKSGPNLGGVVNPDSSAPILGSEMEKLTKLDFRDKVKVTETLTGPKGGTTKFSALWKAGDRQCQRISCRSDRDSRPAQSGPGNLLPRDNSCGRRGFVFLPTDTAMSWLLHEGCGPPEDRHLVNIFVRHENLRINGFGGENAHRSSFRRTRCGLKQSARRGEIAICTLLAPVSDGIPAA